MGNCFQIVVGKIYDLYYKLTSSKVQDDKFDKYACIYRCYPDEIYDEDSGIYSLIFTLKIGIMSQDEIKNEIKKQKKKINNENPGRLTSNIHVNNYKLISNIEDEDVKDVNKSTITKTTNDLEHSVSHTKEFEELNKEINDLGLLTSGNSNLISLNENENIEDLKSQVLNNEL